MPAVSPLIFFGTPEFAVPTLDALAAAGRLPARIVAQPARPAGRGRNLEEPAVARWARAQGVPLSQPQRVRAPEFIAELRPLAPALAVVVAFGQIFPPDLLALPGHGCINVHASLLPLHRGAAPIQAAIAAGDAATGVTTMRMEEGLDSGPILLQEQTAIGPRETAGELAARLAVMGGQLVVATLARLERGDLEERPQDVAHATYASRLTRDSGRVDWQLTAETLDRRLRAFTPWPGLTAELGGEPVKLLRARPLPEAAAPPPAAGAEPGIYLGPVDGFLAVACGGGTLLGIAELQRAGRKSAAALDFANGERLRVGQRFS
jgi:methionyl-tRNA formyltransferase